jgi:cyclic beta-1,2-glucan synthetase
MFRVALESVLGITLVDGKALRIAPCVPAAWPGYTVRYRLPDGATTYEIAVTQRDGEGITATLDGRQVEAGEGAVLVPLTEDGAVHRVEVSLGRA